MHILYFRRDYNVAFHCHRRAIYTYNMSVGLYLPITTTTNTLNILPHKWYASIFASIFVYMYKDVTLNRDASNIRGAFGVIWYIWQASHLLHHILVIYVYWICDQIWSTDGALRLAFYCFKWQHKHWRRVFGGRKKIKHGLVPHVSEYHFKNAPQSHLDTTSFICVTHNTWRTRTNIYSPRIWSVRPRCV